MRSGKIWGFTENIFEKNNVEVHRIEIEKGGVCSKHKHLHKFNLFYVEAGHVKISTWKNDYDLMDDTVLELGMVTIVPPGEFHQFTALESSIVFEIYWTELTKDIVRESVGMVIKI